MNPNEAAELLLSKDNILIVTHKNPDGDTVGSASALCHALKRAGRTAWLFMNDAVTDKLLPYAAPLFAPEGFSPEFYVAVDVAAPDMQCRGADFSYGLVIDHHPTNPAFGEHNCIYPQCSACGEIVLQIIESMHDAPDRDEADMLYIAVTTDTGCFQYANTNAETLDAAARLLRYGADSYHLNARFFRRVSIARLKLEGMIYSSMRFFREGKIVVVTVTRDMIEKSGVTEDDLNDIAGLGGRAETHRVTVTIRENADGSSKVSMRSVQEIDSSAVCARFGGGGHRMASGCTIHEGVDRAAELIVSALDEVWTDIS